MLLLVAFAAILIPLILIVGLRISARYGMPIAALSLAFLGSAIWGMNSDVLAASALQGMHRTLTILWILSGAIFFLYVMQKTGAMERITQGFFRISTDMRIQAVLVAVAFVAILEGVSGFGTPAAIAVPLLMALGFHPLSSIVLALVGDSAPTSFGALGTPLSVGLSNVPNDGGALIANVAGRIVVIDSLYTLLLPVIVMSILVVSFGRKSERTKDILEVLPWGLLMGATYAIVAFLSTMFLGEEFTSVIAGAITLLVGVSTARHGMLQPAVPWRHHAMPENREIKYEKPTMSLVKAWLPYGILIALLFLQHLVPFIRELSLRVANLSWNGILGFNQISSQWQVLYSPGTILIFVSLITAMMFRKRWATLSFASSEMMKRVLVTALPLVATLVMVQIFSNSGINTFGLPSMPVYVAEAFAATFGPVWLAISPFMGTLSAFIMGSSTVSTLTMSPVQYSVASHLGIPVDIAMAQQISGANAGNAIAIHNVVAASAVAGLHHQEWRVIRRTSLFAGVYVVCSIFMTLLVLLFT